MIDDNELPEKRSFDDLLMWYENQPWLRAVVQGVPLAGGSVDTLLAWRATHFSKKRIQAFFKEVSERLSSIERVALNKDFLQSEEFFEILQACAQTVAQTASEFKRKRVADFLTGTIRTGDVHELSKQIVEDINALQDLHLIILG